MIECILTLLMYIGLMLEYLVLYPDTVQWFENTVVIILMLGCIVCQMIRQSVWIVNPKYKYKVIVNVIFVMNFIVLILIFMVDVIWKMVNERIYIVACISVLFLLQVLLILVQNWYLKKEKLSWKNEFLLLEKKTEALKKIKYEEYLHTYHRFCMIFSIVYLSIENQQVSIALIIIYLGYAIYAYHKTWKNGYMRGIIFDFEKKKYYVTVLIVSGIVLFLNGYLPKFISWILILAPDLLLRLYLQRYISSELQKGFE